MRHLSILLALAGTLVVAQPQAACAQAFSRPATAVRPGHYGSLSPEAQVQWSNQETFRASAARDSGRLRELLHDDYFRLGTDGSRRKKLVVTQWTAGGPPDGSRDAPARARVRLVNPGMALLWQDDVHITAAGDTTRTSHETDLWVKEAGRWQLYAVTSKREQMGADVRAIRAGSARRNRAYAARDTAQLTAISTPDFQMTMGGGTFAGRAGNVAGLARMFAQRPDLTLVFTPETVTTGNGFGSEAGSWVETWGTPSGPIRLSGSYLVQWVPTPADGPAGWRQKAVMLVPTGCEGAGCR